MSVPANSRRLVVSPLSLVEMPSRRGSREEIRVARRVRSLRANSLSANAHFALEDLIYFTCIAWPRVSGAVGMIEWARAGGVTQPEVDAVVKARADLIRSVLVHTRSVEQALLTLSQADHPTLCEVAAGYGLHPAPVIVLRERLAHAHVLLVSSAIRGAAVLSTERVTVDHIHDWAQATLGEWLDGHYEFDRSAGGQFRIVLVGDDGDRGQVFEVTTPERHDARRFRVMLAVTEEPMTESGERSAV